ncbi:MAG: hypothetical protein ABIX28_13135 [Vicinamibacterales bacterium]
MSAAAQLTQWSRRCAPVIFIAIVLGSALSAVPTLQWNLHLWRRLNETHRLAPQSAMDVRFRALRAYLPANGVVCLRQTPASAADVTAAASIRVQYALAPLLIVEGDVCDYTIVVGQGAAAVPMGDARVVHVFDDELLLRRSAP